MESASCCSSWACDEAGDTDTLRSPGQGANTLMSQCTLYIVISCLSLSTITLQPLSLPSPHNQILAYKFGKGLSCIHYTRRVALRMRKIRYMPGTC